MCTNHFSEDWRRLQGVAREVVQTLPYPHSRGKDSGVGAPQGFVWMRATCFKEPPKRQTPRPLLGQVQEFPHQSVALASKNHSVQNQILDLALSLRHRAQMPRFFLALSSGTPRAESHF